MSLFIQNEYNLSYEDSMDKLWHYINKRGTPLFHRYQLNDLWAKFSDEVDESIYFNVSEYNIERFIVWLGKQN